MKYLHWSLSATVLFFCFACDHAVITTDLLEECEVRYELNSQLIKDLKWLQQRYERQLNKEIESDRCHHPEATAQFIQMLDSIQSIMLPTEQYLDDLSFRLDKGNPQHQQRVLTTNVWLDLEDRLEKTFLSADSFYAQIMEENLKTQNEMDWVFEHVGVHKKRFAAFQDQELEHISNIEAKVLLSALQLSFLEHKVLYWKMARIYLPSSYRRTGDHCDFWIQSAIKQETIPLNPNRGDTYLVELGLDYKWGVCFLQQYTQEATQLFINGKACTSEKENPNKWTIKLPRPKNNALDSVVIAAKYEDQDGIYHHLVDTFYYQ
ncbi:MAG: hypothetical protein MK212_11890 [Saprospiraceae bacterium]|nr:hypothetical protein [Saprospiraceae bacterium]